MSARVLARRLVAVVGPGVQAPPARIARRAEIRGLACCDVCSWPVAPAVIVPGRKPRHPGCVCCVCDAPLLLEQMEPGVLWHPQCRPVVAPPTLRVVADKPGELAVVPPAGSAAWREIYRTPPDVRFEVGQFCPIDDTHLHPDVRPLPGLPGWVCPTCRAGWDLRGSNGRWLADDGGEVQ